MKLSLYDANTYMCRIKALEKQVNDFRSGKKYMKIRENHKKDMDDMNRRISVLSAELADAHQQTARVRNLWLDVFEDVEKENEKSRKALESKNNALKDRVLEVERQRDDALDRLKVLHEKYAETASLLEEAQETIQKLKAQLNHDHENSSIPSSKVIGRSKIQNSREQSGRKPGAQPGHAHNGRKKQDVTNTVTLPAPEEAEKDRNYVKTDREIIKQVVSISLDVNVTEYHAYIYHNTVTGKDVHAVFPKGVTDDVNYDSSIKAFLYLLNNDCCTSIDKCSKFLYDLSGGKLKLSKGMINKLGKSFSGKSKQEIQAAFDRLLTSPVLHTDCTNANVNGTSAYVFICAEPDGEALYFARSKKGHDGVKGTVTEGYQGILVHDHEATFSKYGASHQECLAHVSRYLKDSVQNEPDLTWSSQMRSLIKEMIHYRNGIPEGGKTDPLKVQKYEKKYDEIIGTAAQEYADSPPGKYYRDGYNLYRRMEAEKEKYLLFLHDTRVPTTNNMAERLLRAYKRKQVQATVFRSEESISYLCDGMSMLYLMRKKNEANLFEAVKEVFER